MAQNNETTEQRVAHWITFTAKHNIEDGRDKYAFTVKEIQNGVQKQYGKAVQAQAIRRALRGSEKFIEMGYVPREEGQRGRDEMMWTTKGTLQKVEQITGPQSQKVEEKPTVPAQKEASKGGEIVKKSNVTSTAQPNFLQVSTDDPIRQMRELSKKMDSVPEALSVIVNSLTSAEKAYNISAEEFGKHVDRIDDLAILVQRLETSVKTHSTNTKSLMESFIAAGEDKMKLWQEAYTAGIREGMRICRETH